LPEVQPEQPSSEGDPSASAATAPSSATLKDYIVKLEEFADNINGVNGDSLQSLVFALDRPGTPFDGISSRTKSEIVRVAETLLSISEKLKSFIIGAARNQ
jgi:hypothetical protein